jgi:peptide deformylase
MIKPILLYPDARLRTTSQPVDQEYIDSDEYKELVKDLRETLEQVQGFAISAIQIGIPKQVTIFTLAHDYQQDQHIIDASQGVFVNMSCSNYSDIDTYKQVATLRHQMGCLCFPSVSAYVSSWPWLHVVNNGTTSIAVTRDFTAAIQHEVDHYNGKLIVDYQSPIKRQSIDRAMRRVKRQLAKASVDIMNRVKVG